MRRFLVILLAVICAGFAQAEDIGPAGGLMCNAETTTSVPCQDSAGRHIVLDTSQYESVTFDLSESTGTFTCYAYGNNLSYEGNTTGQQLHATALTTSAYSVTLQHPPKAVWIQCSAIEASESVTARWIGRWNR